MDKLKISIVIPVFYFENTIQDTVEKTSQILENYEIVDVYKIIPINNGSRVASGERCRELWARKQYML